MQVLPPRFDDAGAARASENEARARRGNRRRALVFLGVFALAMIAGQAWNFSRPLEYRTQSRIRVHQPHAGGAAAAASGAYGGSAQVLDSRPMLEKVARLLMQRGQRLPGGPEAAAAHLQSLLLVQPVPGSEVVQLVASGEDPALLAPLLDALPEVLRADLEAGQSKAADEQLATARQELARLEQTARERRLRLETFRNQSGLIAEREENEAVARSKGLATALNNAVEKEAAADARVRSLESGLPAGRGSLQARDDPTLASLETRASQAREELRDMERTYTPEFLAMDPKARAVRARLAEIERQITQQRSASQQTSLRIAREEQAAAHALVERLRGQLAAAKPALVGVSSRLAQAKVMEEDLAQVERARRELLERVARMEADDRRKLPKVEVIERAVPPTAPWRPDRQQDGLLVAGASLMLALLMMGLVELFNRAPPALPQPGNTTVLVTPHWGATAGPALAAPNLAQAPLLAGQAGAAALPPPPPEVLEQDEVAALLAAAQGPARLACAAGLLGLTSAEACALRSGDIDHAGSTLRVGGTHARAVPLPGWLLADLPAAGGDGPLLRDGQGQAITEAELQSLLAFAALDAGLPQGVELTMEDLRNTCIAWLLGQGLRFSDLPSRVGRVEAARVAGLAGRSGTAREPGAPQPLMPALRQPPAA